MRTTVRVTSYSLWHTGPPVVTYQTYRWRWLARLDAFLLHCALPPTGVFFAAEVLPPT